MEFKITTNIAATPETVFNAWLSSETHTAMTGGDAEISNAVGSRFSTWDGYIQGENIALEPYKRILQTWRTTEFLESDEDSQVEILLKDVNGQTELTLIHTRLSEEGEQYINGWKNHYFAPMKEYFGH
jgi:uncharacterized protein YndB with AHSA1/START domain